MKKNFALILFLVAIFYSMNGHASNQRWVPEYQKKSATTAPKTEVKKAPAFKQVVAKPDKKTEENKTAKVTTKTKEADHSDLDETQKELLSFFKMNLTGASGKKVKDKTLKMAGKAIPVLIKVMRDQSFPDNSRWLATFLVGRIMGVKSAPYMAKYTTHPNWVLRLASLKVLMALNQKQYKGIYTRALKDDALVIRVQALDVIEHFKLTELAPYVWSMLYDDRNYSGGKGKRERTHIIKRVILAIGNLKFEQAKKPMLAMIKDKKYQDISAELDIALSKVTDVQSPKGTIEAKKFFWSREQLKEKTI